MWKTLAAYLLGCLVASQLSVEAMSRASLLLTAITVTALVVSFKHPFASLAQSEWWQKPILEQMPSVLFGIVTPLIWHEAGVAGMVILIVSGSIHFASWKNSSDSRGYRLNEFREGLAGTMPATNRLISLLNGRGLSDEADEIIQAILRGTAPDFSKLSCISPQLEKLIELSEKEVSQ